MREQRIRLEHHADIALNGRLLGHVLAAYEDPALAHMFEPGNQPQRRGLAAAAGAEQGDQRALRNAEGHVVDGNYLAVLFGDALEDQRALRVGSTHDSTFKEKTGAGAAPSTRSTRRSRRLPTKLCAASTITNMTTIRALE